MSQRYTRKDAEKALERLCELMGVKANPALVRMSDGTLAYEEDGWTLDSNPTYGGYKVASVTAGSTGEGEPFGPMRRNARDFWQMVWDITRALEIKGA